MHIKKQVVVAGLAGVVVGAGALLGARYIAYSPERVHYHANFDVYINGQREAFNGPMYYEEEGGGTCAADTAMTPGERAHMHDNVSDVVHVEDHAVTWGQFFQNLGWVVDDKLIQTRDHLYQADKTHKVTFLVNGQAVQDIAMETIGDKDRLLVDFGDTDETTLQKELKDVPSTAGHYNETKDPDACMGNISPTMRERMRHLL